MLVKKQKKPMPAKGKKSVSSKGKTSAPAKGKKPVPAKGKMPAAAAGKKPERPQKKKAVQAVRTKAAASGSAAPKAPADGKAILFRVLIAVTAVLAAFGIVLSAVSLRNEHLQRKVELYYAGMLQESGVSPITITDEQVRQSVRNTKRHGNTRAFTYYCARTLKLDAETRRGYILFGNPADNDCDLVLSILDENDNLIYRTGGVEPGKYLTMIRPDVDEWECGTYTCKAYVCAYEGEGLDYKCIGAQYSRLTVKIGETS